MKKPLNLDEMLLLIETAIAPNPKAAMFELYEPGFATLFYLCSAGLLLAGRYV